MRALVIGPVYVVVGAVGVTMVLMSSSALESNDALGSRGLSLPPFPSRKDYAHLFYLALTRLWAIYHLSPYAHTFVFTLHVILASMP